jgi:hypothetical protein
MVIVGCVAPARWPPCTASDSSSALSFPDASEVDTSLVGHFYYADATSVLTDLIYLLREGRKPDQRAFLQPRGQPPNRYWVFVH